MSLDFIKQGEARGMSAGIFWDRTLRMWDAGYVMLWDPFHHPSIASPVLRRERKKKRT